MPETRRTRIEAFLAADPGDQFLRYSLAMELDKECDHERSLNGLRGLQMDATPYVPAFFMAAQQLVKLSRIAEARDALRSGIEHARQQNNAHAAGEMSEFLASLGRRGINLETASGKLRSGNAQTDVDFARFVPQAPATAQAVAHSVQPPCPVASSVPHPGPQPRVNVSANLLNWAAAS